MEEEEQPVKIEKVFDANCVSNEVPRVLYSFPYRIGSGRICSTAWHQAQGAALGGAKVTVLSGSVQHPFDPSVNSLTTLAFGGVRLPVRFLGTRRASQIHDWRTARWLERNAEAVDIVHGWPLASLRTIRMAKKLGIPFLLERPNAHTAYAYEASAKECDIVGIELPNGHDHHYDQQLLEHEELEYDEADYLLCPSEFVSRTFLDRGFSNRRLLRHHYGYDHNRFCSGNQNAASERGLVMIYVGVCEPRKGLHYALRSWLDSGAHERGRFLICGSFVPGYAERLGPLLSHPSVEILGHREDVPQLMKESDLFILPSVEEGSALVTYEARGSGCVLLVSDGAGAVCRNGENAMLHPMRNTKTLSEQIRHLDRDRSLVVHLRTQSLATVGEITWDSAGHRLKQLYSQVLAGGA